jgi:hypothetical protein
MRCRSSSNLPPAWLGLLSGQVPAKLPEPFLGLCSPGKLSMVKCQKESVGFSPGSDLGRDLVGRVHGVYPWWLQAKKKRVLYYQGKSIHGQWTKPQLLAGQREKNFEQCNKSIKLMDFGSWGQIGAGPEKSSDGQTTCDRPAPFSPHEPWTFYSTTRHQARSRVLRDIVSRARSRGSVVSSWIELSS